MFGLRVETDGESLLGRAGDMKGLFFDENLPSRLRFKPSLPLVAGTELGNSPTDTQVWEFARQRELVIVSKDADFSARIILNMPPPWVVHLRFGNLRRKDFHELLARVWPQVEALLTANKLVNVYVVQFRQPECRCQKQPWTKMAVLDLGRTMSTDTGRSLGRAVLPRSPLRSGRRSNASLPESFAATGIRTCSRKR